MDQIQNFKQRDDEVFYKYWEHYKDLLAAIPHHNFPMYLLINYFYLCCTKDSKQLLDTMGGGDFMGKNPDDAWEFLDGLAERAQTWQYIDPSEQAMRNQGPSGSGKFSVSEHNVFETKLEELSAKLDKMNQLPTEEVCALNQCWDPYSNTYNSGLRSNSTFRWGNQNEAGSSTSQAPPPPPNQTWRQPQFQGPPRFPASQGPPGFIPPNQFQGQNQFQHQQAPPPLRSLEDTMNAFCQMQTTTNEQIAQATNDIRNQMGKLTTTIGVFQQEKDKLPTQPMANPQGQHLIGSSSVTFPEQAKAIISLRSGKTIDNAYVEPPVTPILLPFPIPSKPTTSDGESPKQASTEKEKDKAKESDVPQAFTVHAPYPN
ncbi:uncharacterized protein LOC131329536 [Rhododendron vialii]|uniref:uncharacterized protein LOC131329536 n=1 Tax=Rhododendron vialii TaxID=182163 RepID=UPI00265D8A3A|nr:uncharacterized protein LOC131329536 [Rhododendron vialii]